MRATFEKLSVSPDQSFRYKRWRVPRVECHWHYHPEYELTYIVRGHGHRFVGDHSMDYASGDLVLIGPGLPHTWCSTFTGQSSQSPLHEAIVIHFSSHFLGDSLWQQPEFRTVSALLNSASRGIQFDRRVANPVGALLHAMATQRGLSQLLNLLHTLEQLGHDTDAWIPLSSPHFVPVHRHRDQRRIDGVCAYVAANYDRPIRLQEAAELTNMTPASFSRFFKRAVGCSFITYVNELRVGQACHLLMDGELTISEVCYESGFQNLANFNRMFKRYKGMPPSDYRRKFQHHPAHSVS